MDINLFLSSPDWYLLICLSYYGCQGFVTLALSWTLQKQGEAICDWTYAVMELPYWIFPFLRRLHKVKSSVEMSNRCWYYTDLFVLIKLHAIYFFRYAFIHFPFVSYLCHNHSICWRFWRLYSECLGMLELNSCSQVCSWQDSLKPCRADVLLCISDSTVQQQPLFLLLHLSVPLIVYGSQFSKT